MRFILVAALVMLQLTVSASAQPRIESHSGNLEDSAAIVLTGTRFGNKSRANPLLYDTVNNIPAYDGRNLQHGDVVPIVDDGDCPDCPWVSTGWGQRPEIFNQGTRVDGRPMYFVNKKGYFRGANPLAPLGEDGTVYVSWWVRTNHKLYQPQSGEFVYNKLMRFTAGSSESEWVNQVEVESQNSYGTVLGCTADGWDWFGGHSELQTDTWHHIELVVQGGGNLAAGTGSAKVYMNGVMVSQTNSLYSCNGMLDQIYVWGSDPHITSAYPSDSEVIFGELYLDTTLARVVLSDSDTYQVGNSSQVHWEIQPVTSWSDDSIEVDLNLGTFSGGDPLYLYVIDANGNLSPSYDLLQGETLGPGEPGQPIRETRD